jgi:hypothetical protein
MTVTPETARLWLSMDVLMRPVRKTKLAEFARDMRGGSWVLNGETIKRASDGGVLDGIHRLTAVAEAGVSIRSWVIEGLPPEVQSTIDTGSPRTMSDQLHMRGVPNSVLLAAITKRGWRWLQGHRGSGGPTPTHTEMDLMIATVPVLAEAASYAQQARRDFPMIRASAYGTAYLIFSGISNIAARAFLEMVSTGESLHKGDPALAVRSRMIQAAKPGERRLSEHEQLALIITGWNAWRDERSLAHVQLPAGGLKAGNFPEPK